MSDILHTFVVLAYKDSPFIEECINSLVKQTIRSHIVLSTSTPSEFLRQVAKSYNVDFHVTDHEPGIAKDWNTALKIAKTPYVTLAHQDDVYHPIFTQKTLEVMTKFPNNLFAFTDYQELVNNSLRTHTPLLVIKRILRWPFFYMPSIHQRWRKRLLLAFGSPIPCPAVTYNREMLGDFSFDETFRINLDWDAWERLSRVPGSFAYVPGYLMAHRIHPESETTKGLRDNRRLQEDLLLFRRFWGKLLSKLIILPYKLSYLSNK